MDPAESPTTIARHTPRNHAAHLRRPSMVQSRFTCSLAARQPPSCSRWRSSRSSSVPSPTWLARRPLPWPVFPRPAVAGPAHPCVCVTRSARARVDAQGNYAWPCLVPACSPMEKRWRLGSTMHSHASSLGLHRDPLLAGHGGSHPRPPPLGRRRAA